MRTRFFLIDMSTGTPALTWTARSQDARDIGRAEHAARDRAFHVNTQLGYRAVHVLRVDA